MASGDPNPSFAWMLIEGLTALVTTLIGFITIRLHNKVDALEKTNMDNAEKAQKYVTRDELKESLSRMAAERQRMHDQNREDRKEDRELLEEIRGLLDGLPRVEEKTRRNEADIQQLTQRMNNQQGLPGVQR